MHRMMQSSGTSEGLRTLIDTSILKSIKKIVEYRGLFGASVLPIGARGKPFIYARLTIIYSDQHHGDFRA